MKRYELGRFGLDGLVLTEVSAPEPGPSDVVVRWHAWSLNHRDLLFVEGSYGLDTPLPFTPLSDAAGEVVAVGSEVNGWRPGDRVVSHLFIDWQSGPPKPEYRAAILGGPLPGLLAECSLLPERALVPLPAYLSYAEGATLTIAGVTAWNALFDAESSALRPGSTVLLEGTGGVSIFALQLAHAAGLRTIITSSNNEKIARAKALGADAAINYRATPVWSEAVRDLTQGYGADLAIDVGGASTLNESFRSVRMGGTIALVGMIGGGKVEIDVQVLFRNLARIRGVGVGSRADFINLLRAIEVRQIHPIIDREFAFSAAPAAFAYLKSGAHFGKIVIVR